MGMLRDKKLLLLGILGVHSLHGYQLNQLLDSPANAIRIGKGNAYQLLAKLEKSGFVSSRTEQEGKRPPRQIYSLTAAGREEFKALLVERLADHEAADLPDAVSLNFLSVLEPEHAIQLVEERLTRVRAKTQPYQDYSDAMRRASPGLDYLVRHGQFEESFLEDLLQRLKGDLGSS
ncbi:PadR family transcriptional regulator [Rhodovibrionaceae bacterium A322]